MRERIESGLSRIVGLYVALSAGLLGLLAIGVSQYDVMTRLSQDREIIATRLTADLQSVSRQLDALASSSLTWTGLTDSFGRETYLAPLLSRSNAGPDSRFLVLDYRGRAYLVPEGAQSARVIGSETVRRAVAEGRASWGLLQADLASGAPEAEGVALLPEAVVLVRPVLSPQTSTAVGFVVAEYDPRTAVAELPLAPGLDIKLTMARAEPPAWTFDWMDFRSGSRLRVGQSPSTLDLDLEVGRQRSGPLLRALTVALVIGLLGLMLSRQIQRWTHEFAGNTTRRLDQLVVTCRDILDGRPVALDNQADGDEISAVLATLHQMLHVQQQITNDLRTAARVFETSGEAIMVTDTEGRIVETNPALSRMTGYARLELIGQPAGVLYKEAENPQTSGLIAQALRRDGVWRGETTFRHRDGHLVPSIVAISRLGSPVPGERSGMVAVMSDISVLKAAQEQLHHMAYRDSLTGLPNFRALTEALQARLAAADAPQRPFAVMFFDMDHLKAVNDTHGHDVGDAVIQALSRHLETALPPGHLLCRRSGDEFVALVDCAAEADAASLRARLGERFGAFEASTPRGPIAVSVSTGVARYPQDGRTMQELLIRADDALLQVKQSGRGRMRWVDADADLAAGRARTGTPGR